MANSTTPINQAINDPYYTLRAPVLGSSQVVPYGCLAMNDGGKIKSANTGVAGSTLLGMSMQNLNETTGADVTLDRPAVFARGLQVELQGKAGDLPTAANLGGFIALQDNQTCKATIVANDLQVELVEILTNGNFVVRLP